MLEKIMLENYKMKEATKDNINTSSRSFEE